MPHAGIYCRALGARVRFIWINLFTIYAVTILDS